MVEGSLRSDGMFVGQDLYSGGSVFYTPWVLCTLWIITAPNLVLARIVRSKKSSLAKSLHTRSLLFGQRVYLFGNLKGEHTAMANVMVGNALELGHGLHTRLNTLDEGHHHGGSTDQERGTTVTSLRRGLIGTLAETVSVRRLAPLEYTVNNLALTAMAAENEVPILPMVVDHISTPPVPLGLPQRPHHRRPRTQVSRNRDRLIKLQQERLKAARTRAEEADRQQTAHRSTHNPAHHPDWIPHSSSAPNPTRRTQNGHTSPPGSSNSPIITRLQHYRRRYCSAEALRLTYTRGESPHDARPIHRLPDR